MQALTHSTMVMRIHVIARLRDFLLVVRGCHAGDSATKIWVAGAERSLEVAHYPPYAADRCVARRHFANNGYADI